MFKLPGRLISPLKDLRSNPAELVEWLVLLIVAVVGLFIAVTEVLGYPVAATKHAGEVTLGLVGLLALHFCIERFTVMQRVERRLKVLEILPPKMPPTIEPQVNSFFESTCKLHELLKDAEHDNAQFPLIVNSILKKQAVQLEELSEGKLNVSSDRTAIVNQALLDRYKKRFDAVSFDDLKYWATMSPDAAAYFYVHKQAIDRNATIVTRIFILPKLELISEKLDLARVLKEQHDAGIGWGVAIQEDLSYEITSQEKPLDFALYDRNKALSVFNGRGVLRTFQTTFATHENNREISVYKKLYRDLVPECYLVNQRFVDSYPGALAPSELDEVMEKCKKRHRAWNVRLGQPDAVFPFVTSDTKEVQEKVDLLVKMIT
jgi:hypothetical protein